MEKLFTVEAIIKALEENTDDYNSGWRLQDKKYGISSDHKSKPIACQDEDLEEELTEEGYSCFCNPEYLAQYVSDFGYCNKTDHIIVFNGTHMGEGMDGEDIIEPWEEDGIIYSIEVELFLQACCNHYGWELDNIPSWS